ncbi:MAG: DNA-directed RNA polymerase subunit H [archaeon]
MSKKESSKTEDTKPISHDLVPKHEKVSDREKKTLFERYHISIVELPKISANDPAIRHLEVVVGDVIKISRTSMTAGHATYYRSVV